MKPIKVNDVEMVFGGNISKLLPPIEQIPKHYPNKDKWIKVINDWFFKGLEDVEWIPKEGIDLEDAIRHVSAVMCSFEPKHEHKSTGCAYLLSLFFEDVKYSN